MPERQINPVTLRFWKNIRHLDSDFKDEYFESSKIPLRTAMIALVLFYMGFVFLDRVIDPDNFNRFFQIRFLIIGPGALLFVIFTFHRYFKLISQPLTAFMMIFGASGLIYMIAIGNADVHLMYGSGLYLVLISLFAFLRVRFIWAVPTGLLILIGYFAVILSAGDIPGSIVVLNLTFMGSFTLLGLIVCYQLELLTRKEYLAKYNLKLERGMLEKSVIERTGELERSHRKLLLEAEEREKLEAKLNQTQRLESLGLLAGGVAHDFNNILTGILGSVSLARFEKDITPQLEAYLNDVETGAIHAAELTRQLLAFSRRQQMETAPVETNKLILNLSRMLGRIIGEYIDIDLDLSSETGQIHVDRGQIEQVITNLSVNARDAMPKGGKLLIQTLSVLSNDEEKVHIIISDNGTGMEMETMRKIFEPFFTTKEVGKGTGLGLATSFGIIQQHGGTLSVQSSPGVGSTFTIELPRWRGEDIISEHNSLEELLKGDGQSILLVEDDPEVLRIGSDFLEILGYSLLSTSSPLEAIDIFRNNHVDLLFTDLIMPEMNGAKLAKTLHILDPSLPVVFTSGYTSDILETHGVEESSMILLPKPYTIEDLSVRIYRALKNTR